MSSNFNFSKNSNGMNSIEAQIQRTKSNIQETIRKLSNKAKNTGKRFLSNTRNYQNKLNRSIQKASEQTVQEGNGLIYFILGLLFILLLVALVLIIYYLMTDCEEKKSLTDYIYDPRNPCLKDAKSKLTDENEKRKKGLEIDIKLPTLRQVFHLSNQDYTYDQAKCKCNAYGARLATESEINDAFNKGADWCSYGWSEGQQAFYPTQQETYEKMGDNCGKPGVNGGFFANPNLKFGVNCYGIKPDGEVIKAKVPKETPFCQRKGNFQASNKLDADKVAPFNGSQWSQ